MSVPVGLPKQRMGSCRSECGYKSNARGDSCRRFASNPFSKSARKCKWSEQLNRSKCGPIRLKQMEDANGENDNSDRRRSELSFSPFASSICFNLIGPHLLRFNCSLHLHFRALLENGFEAKRRHESPLAFDL